MKKKKIAQVNRKKKGITEVLLLRKLLFLKQIYPIDPITDYGTSKPLGQFRFRFGQTVTAATD